MLNFNWLTIIQCYICEICGIYLTYCFFKDRLKAKNKEIKSLRLENAKLKEAKGNLCRKLLDIVNTPATKE